MPTLPRNTIIGQREGGENARRVGLNSEGKMTLGTHCPQCGEDECRWSVGKICEGRAPKPGVGKRLSVFTGDFNSRQIIYYVERLQHGWFFKSWREIDGTRADTPIEAIERSVDPIQWRARPGA